MDHVIFYATQVSKIECVYYSTGLGISVFLPVAHLFQNAVGTLTHVIVTSLFACVLQQNTRYTKTDIRDQAILLGLALSREWSARGMAIGLLQLDSDLFCHH